MRLIALSCAALASIAAHCPHSPWAFQPAPEPNRGPQVFFDSGAVVRVHLENSRVITGPLLTSFAPGAEQLSLRTNDSSISVPLAQVDELKMPYSGASIGMDLGFRVGGVAALSRNDEDTDGFMLGMLAGAIVGGALGSRVTRWLTVAERTGTNLTWIPTRPTLIPLPSGHDEFVTLCDRGDMDFRNDLIAVARGVNGPDGPFFTEIRQAWVVDPVAHRIVPTSKAGIRCLNEQWSTPLPMASGERSAAALRFAAPAGKAVIYVHQRALYETEGRELEVALDGRFAGRTSPGTFLMLEVEPGEHRVGAVGHDKKFVLLTAAADSVYFVRLHNRRGLRGWGMGRIEPVDGATGRKMIGAAQLVASKANAP